MYRKIAIALSAVAVLATPLAAQTAATNGGAVPADPVFQAKLRATLLQNPEIILEMAQLAQQRQRDHMVAAQNLKVADLRPALFAAEPYGPVLGNPNAKTTVVELLDYACPFCKRAHDGVDKLIDGDKNIRVIVMMRPILGAESEVLARFALAAALQGKFRETHDALYEKFGDDHQTHATDDNLRAVAAKAGVDFDRAKKDMTGDKVEKMLQKHKDAADQMGVQGTPFFVTPASVIPGYVTEDQLRAEVAKKIAAK